MKALKLIGVLVLIVGIIAGAIYLPDIMKYLNNHNPWSDETVDEQLKVLVEDIENEWEQSKKWDLERYKGHRNKILIKEEDLGQDQVNIAYDRLNLIVSDILWEEMQDEFEKRDCDKRKVVALKKGADYVDKKKKDDNPNLSELKKCYDAYIRIYNFANSYHYLNVAFDGDNWADFSAHSNSVLNSRKNYLDNRYYSKYLSNIQKMKDGLNKDNVERKLGHARLKFYEDLEKEIISYYDAHEKTEANLERLKKCLEKLDSQNKDGELNDLSDRLGTYCDSYEENLPKNDLEL